MPDTVLVPGMATAIGSLPHRDAGAAAALVLRCLPELPAAPQLPMRTPLEGVVAQWARAIDGVDVRADGIARRRTPTFDSRSADRHHVRRATRTAACSRSSRSPPRSPKPPRRVKVQCAGPLTLGVAFVEAGMPVDIAFRLGARTARAWARALAELVAERLPDAALAALLRRAGARALARAERRRSTARSRPTFCRPRSRRRRCLSAVHVCGHGDLRLALDAGPQLVHFDVGALDLDDAVTLSRFLDGGGWIDLGRDPHRTGRSASSRAAVEGAARRVVRADPPRLRSGHACARRRSSHPRADSPATA